MKPAFADTGIVLKSLDFSEADKLVGLITHAHGYREFIAKGARRMNSKKAPHLDMFNLIRFQVGRGHHPQLLIQAESECYFPQIKNNFSKVKIALSVAEILTQTLPPEEDDPNMFVSLHHFLDGLELAETRDSYDRLFHQFGLYLLRHLGFPPPQSGQDVDLSEYFERIISRRMVSRTIK